MASETRSPLSASRLISACSRAEPRPAATSMVPTSLRSSPVAWDSQSRRGGGGGPRATRGSVLLLRCTGRNTRDRAQPPCDRGPRPTQRLELAAERFDVGPACTEQPDTLFGAPGD